MNEINIKDEYIKLGQALKLSGIATSGVEAKSLIEDSLIRVNKNVETRRGKKLYKGDIIEFNNKEFKIV